jgi:ubiquinone/menaquinone biosynthesis C-methylase UbiE
MARGAAMSYVPDFAQWVRDRMEYIPRETANWCGDLSGQSILDLGCGDMLAAFGLLSLKPRHITCVDVALRGWNVPEYAVEEIVNTGFALPEDYNSRLSYVIYDGTRLPFRDNSFDLVFSWGVFEHIADVPAVLAEARRVVKPEGRIFIIVFPWFHTFAGSHLTNYISEPFFHLHRPPDWVYARLQEFVAAHGGEDLNFRGFLGPGGGTLRQAVLEHMWTEYCRLNGYSARMFLAAAMQTGLAIERLQSGIEKVENPPSEVPLADLITHTTTVLFRPAKSGRESDGVAALSAPPSAESVVARALGENNALRQQVAVLQAELAAERRIRHGVEHSVSWRLTKPGRDFMRVVRKLKG